MKNQLVAPRLTNVRGRVAILFAIALVSICWSGSFFGERMVAHAATAPAFVQEKDNQVSSGRIANVTFAAPTTMGNYIVAYLIWDNIGSVSVSDSSGNVYVRAVGPTRWSNNKRYSAEVFYAKNLGAGSTTVTATFATSIRSFGIVYAHEYSGIDPTSPIDGTAGASGSSGSLNSGSVNTSNGTDLLFGAGVSANTITAPGSGYVARSTTHGNMTEDRNVATTGIYNASASNSGGAWAMQLVAFRGVGISQDTTAPTVPVGLSASVVSSSQINLSWNVSSDPDNASGQISYGCFRNGVRFATVSGGITSCVDNGLTAATTYAYTLNAQDPAGNVSALSTGVQATTLGVPLPVITLFTASPASIAAGQPSTLSWSTTNATSLTIDSGVGPVTGTTSVVVHPVVTTVYRLTATNSFGNVTAQATVTITGDTTAPSVPGSLTAIGFSNSRIDLGWTASTDSIGVTGYRIYRNGSAVTTTTTLNYSDTGLAAGTAFTYNVTAFDAAGNTSAQSSSASGSTFANDTTAPTVSISSPGNGQILSGSVTIIASAADNLGVAGVQFYLDGVKLGLEITAAPYSFSWNTSQATNASHLLNAVARDNSGNTTTSAAISVTVGNTSLRPYSTTFPLNENPIREGGNWINGKTDGLDWADIRTTPGFAYGTQSGSNGYDDSVALLTGSWGPDQTVQATVHSVNQSLNYFQEVELWLRGNISGHSITGYEINFRCTGSLNDGYMQIVRWNGPLSSFTYVDHSGIGAAGVKDGDIIKASITGTTIKVWLNDILVAQGTDSTFSSGRPGMGFFLQNTTAGANADFGFTNYTVSDGSALDTLSPSTPGNLSANAVSSSQVNLSWTPSTDNVAVAGYRVFRNSNAVGTSASSTFSDVGLSGNTQYTYTVSAFDSAGNASVQSAPAFGTTLSSDTFPPSIPSGLQTSNITSSSVTVSWSASSDNVGVAGYRLFRNGSSVGTTTSTSYTDTGLAASTSYVYVVAAYDFSGNVSPQSQQIAATTTTAPQAPPSFVQSIETQIGNGTSVSLAFSNATKSGNTVVAYVIWSNNGPVAVTDSRGNAFASVSAALPWGNGFSAQVFYATGITGGADVVTAAFRDSVASFGVLYIHEYSGISSVNPVDVTVWASGSSAMLSSGNALTTSANDLIFAAGVSDNTVTAAGPGFVSRSLSFGNITEDRIAPSAGTYSATAPHYGNIWAMQLVAFRSAN